MKKIKIIFLFLSLIFSSPLLSQKIICHPASHPYECIILNAVVEKYVCDTSALILYNGNEILANGVHGITNKYSDNVYQISVSYYSRNYMDRIWTLLHECGHLIDMINGDLRTNPYYWKGEKIDRDIPYYERPWEINAEKWAKILFFSVVVDTLEEVSEESED